MPYVVTTHRGTALVECMADYEVVGRKGTPVSLSLENVEGFADGARGGGRGAFVPAQDRIESLTALWRQTLAAAEAKHWLLSADVTALAADFDAFEATYNAAVLALRKDALATEKASEVACAYRVLSAQNQSPDAPGCAPPTASDGFSRGTGTSAAFRPRAPMAVICPWHPLRMEAVRPSKQVFGLIEQLLGRIGRPFRTARAAPFSFARSSNCSAHPLYPGSTVVWENTQAFPRVVTQAFDAYTLHQPPEPSSESAMPALDDDSNDCRRHD